MKTIVLMVGVISLFAACSDTMSDKGDGPVEGGVDEVGDDGADGAGGDGTDTSGEGAEPDCDPALADCDAICACDGSVFEDDCVEHQCAEGCTEPQGFWKENEEAWPVTEMTVGGRVYDTPTLVAFMNLPTTGDASITLGTHLIATRLNLLVGVVNPELVEELDAADAWLAANDDGDGLPLGVSSHDDRAVEALTLAAELSDFNSGLLGAGECTPEEEVDEPVESEAVEE